MGYLVRSRHLGCGALQCKNLTKSTNLQFSKIADAFGFRGVFPFFLHVLAWQTLVRTWLPRPRPTTTTSSSTPSLPRLLGLSWYITPM